MAAEAPVPTDRGRELVRGSYDMHVHIAPDTVERRIDDVGLAHRCRELGLAGFELKSHYTSTAERAAVVRGVVPEVEVFGAVTLNRAVGGMNPLAVEIAAREGARTVWLPTVDSLNEMTGAHELAPGAKPPVWMRLQQELRDQGVEIEPVRVVDDAGALLAETRAVLESVARHGMVLATGHLSRDEIFAVVDAAVEAGIATIVITHPEFPAQDVGIGDQVELAAKGALLERCFTTPHTGKVTWERVFEAIRATGPEHSVLSTDLGQVFNPPVEDGLALMADHLLEAGFDEEEIRTMAVTNTRRWAGA
ncbi:MAG: hypothetical protein V7607_6806 [Solirubrobacteraceae bacterium]